MKLLSTIAALIGLLVLIFAFIARLFMGSKFPIFGDAVSAQNLLLLSTTAFVIAIYLRLHGRD